MNEFGIKAKPRLSTTMLASMMAMAMTDSSYIDSREQVSNRFAISKDVRIEKSVTAVDKNTMKKNAKAKGKRKAKRGY